MEGLCPAKPFMFERYVEQKLNNDQRSCSGVSGKTIKERAFGFMDKQYYVINLIWGVVMFCVCVCAWYGLPGTGGRALSKEIVFYGVSAVLYPFSKKFLEEIALSFTSKEFWYSGFFKEGTAKNNVYVIYYAFCYILAVPFSFMFAVRFLLQGRH